MGARYRARARAPLGFSLVLELPAAFHAEMVGHAIRGLPNESCGLFAGPFGSDRVERFFPMRNVAASSQIYELDGHEMMAVEREADEAGLAVIGVMHSHTHTTNYPSPTDVADAARFDPFGSWRFIIVSLKFADPSLRSYRILDGEIDEEPVIIT
jgi:proteasome lid subunit RPN8/RPN11